MSLEQTAYLEQRSVPEREALQAAIDALSFDCKLDDSYTPFKSQGFLPCILNGSNSGVEIYFEHATELLKHFPDIQQAVGVRDRAITFRWGSRMPECACAMILSSALAKSFAAVVHYQDDNIIYTLEQLLQETHTIVKSL